MKYYFSVVPLIIPNDIFGSLGDIFTSGIFCPKNTPYARFLGQRPAKQPNGPSLKFRWFQNLPRYIYTTFFTKLGAIGLMKLFSFTR